MICYGKNNVRAFLQKHHIPQIFLDVKFSDIHFKNFLEQQGIKIIYKPKDFLNELCHNGVHQGVAIPDVSFNYDELIDFCEKNKNDNTKLFILDQLTDPHNLGAIIRTCDAAGINGIIISDRNQVFVNDVVAKVSSGACWNSNIILVKNINNCIIYLKQQGYTIVGTSDKAELCYTDMPKNKKIAIVLGSEGSGIRSLVSRNCDMLVKIPMKGVVSSLNVSVACGILAYELIK